MASTANISMAAAPDHDVVFYADEQQLVLTVCSYFVGALREGDVAVFIGTAAHSAAVVAAMAGRGVDVDEAQRAGRFVVLDAADTLALFMVDDHPDAAAFDDVVGRLIRDAGAGGRNVRAYGEMVALLWGAGQVLAAIELETLWNDLRSRAPFALLCGYPTQVLAGEDLASDVLHVCDLHHEVGEIELPEGAPVVVRAERRFASSATAPRAARWFVQNTLTAWGRPACVPEASLAVTELVSNSVMHAHSDVVVRVSSAHDVVRIAVHDASSELPTPREATMHDASGRGLALVAALANAWGTALEPSGKTVWVEFAANRLKPVVS